MGAVRNRKQLSPGGRHNVLNMDRMNLKIYLRWSGPAGHFARELYINSGEELAIAYIRCGSVKRRRERRNDEKAQA